MGMIWLVGGIPGTVFVVCVIWVAGGFALKGVGPQRSTKVLEPKHFEDELPSHKKVNKSEAIEDAQSKVVEAKRRYKDALSAPSGQPVVVSSFED